MPYKKLCIICRRNISPRERGTGERELTLTDFVPEAGDDRILTDIFGYIVPHHTTSFHNCLDVRASDQQPANIKVALWRLI